MQAGVPWSWPISGAGRANVGRSVAAGESQAGHVEGREWPGGAVASGQSGEHEKGLRGRKSWHALVFHVWSIRPIDLDMLAAVEMHHRYGSISSSNVANGALDHGQAVQLLFTNRAVRRSRRSHPAANNRQERMQVELPGTLGTAP